MKHLDEHTLELYVAGSTKVAKQVDHIDRHLARCAGCARRVGRMREFYAGVHREILHDSALRQNIEGMIAERPPDVRSRYGPVVSRPLRAVEVPWNVMSGFIRRHPAVSGVGVASFLGVLIWGISSLAGLGTAHLPPAYVHYDIAAGTLDVYDRTDRRMGQKPAMRLDRIVEAEESKGIFHTIVSDLAHDRKTSFVTTVPLGGWDDDGMLNRVKIFDEDLNLTAVSSVGRFVTFAGRVYPPDFGPSGILSWEDSSTHHREILANAVGYRSPSVLTRINAEGKNVGEYWHYGHLGGIYEVHLLSPASTDYVILAGINDAKDSVGISFPAIVVLDPSKIIGTSESSASRGFGFERASAEVYYIRLPDPDVCRALGGKNGVRTLKSNVDSLLSFLVQQQSKLFSMEFVFSRNMVLMEVKMSDGFEQLHAQLVKEGKIHSVYGASYLASLKRGAQYWDGRQWRNEVVTVRP